MTVVRVTSIEGTLGREMRESLGERLTAIVLEVETGKDTVEARPGVMVHFDELSPDSWFHGGRPADELYPTGRVVYATATVMQGPWTPALKGALSARLGAALREVLREAQEDSEGESPSVWVTVQEIEDGAWSVNGTVIEIEQLLWAFEPDRAATIQALLDARRA